MVYQKSSENMTKKRNSVVFSVSLPTKHDDTSRIIERCVIEWLSIIIHSKLAGTFQLIIARRWYCRVEPRKKEKEIEKEVEGTFLVFFLVIFARVS